jgi:predicted metal-dependent hydrolase
MILKYGSTEIEFSHFIQPELKKIYVTVDAENGVVVKSPDIKEDKLLELVRKKASWIIEKKSLVQDSLNDFEFVTGSRLPYLGKKYYLQMNEDRTVGVGKAWLSFNHSKFQLTYNPLMMKEEYLRKAIELFYKDKSKDRMTSMIKKWSEKMGLEYGRVTFKFADKRWGSCSGNGNIVFNYEAVKLPVACVEYIVVHELAHIVHRHHDKNFWAMVGKYLPNYKETHERIKGFGL